MGDGNGCVGVLLQSDDPKDKIICALLGSLGTHPAYANMTSNLILSMYGPYRGIHIDHMRTVFKREFPEPRWT